MDPVVIVLFVRNVLTFILQSDSLEFGRVTCTGSFLIRNRAVEKSKMICHLIIYLTFYVQRT